MEQGLYLLRLRETPPAPANCVADGATLCLGGGRYQVDLEWENQHSGASGRGIAVPWSDVAGFFAFDDAANLELMVKLLDFGTERLFFYGQLTNLVFTLTVSDTATGTVRRYGNGPDNCGGIDRDGFSAPAPARRERRGGARGDGVVRAGAVGRGLGGATRAGGPGIPATAVLAGESQQPAPSAAAGCEPTSRRLCLGDGRFAIELRWRNQYGGGSGDGSPLVLSRLTGAFSFDDPANLEVLVKVLDFDDRVLVLWGSLSDLEHSLIVTDTATGAVESYENPPGRYCGGLDADAF
jgi:hypothetical protein